jgi:hypothetical protein
MPTAPETDRRMDRRDAVADLFKVSSAERPSAPVSPGAEGQPRFPHRRRRASAVRTLVLGATALIVAAFLVAALSVREDSTNSSQPRPDGRRNQAPPLEPPPPGSNGAPSRKSVGSGPERKPRGDRPARMSPRRPDLASPPVPPRPNAPQPSPPAATALPPAPGPEGPVPPARRAPALPAPVPPGSPPEFL